MHHPIGFGAFSSASTVVDQGFLQANALIGCFNRIYRLVNACGFPKSGPCDSIRPYAVPILSPSYAEEVPLSISHFSADSFIFIKRLRGKKLGLKLIGGMQKY